MRFFNITLILLLVLSVFVCNAGDLSDSEVDALFNRHKAVLWQPLAKSWAEVKSKMVAPVENLSIPLEYHASGLVKARLFAVKAQIFTNGLVFATGVRVNLYNAKGKPDGFLKAEDCIFDRNESHGYCRGAVEVDKGTDLIKGVGMYFSISNEFIKILSNCEIQTERFKANLGRLL